MTQLRRISAIGLAIGLIGCSDTYHCKIDRVVDLQTREPQGLPALYVFEFVPDTDTGTMLGGEAVGLLAKGPASTKGGYMPPYVAMVKMDGSFERMTLSDTATGRQLHASGSCKKM